MKCLSVEIWMLFLTVLNIQQIFYISARASDEILCRGACLHLLNKKLQNTWLNWCLSFSWNVPSVSESKAETWMITKSLSLGVKQRKADLNIKTIKVNGIIGIEASQNFNQIGVCSSAW